VSPSAREALDHHKYIVRNYGTRRAPHETAASIVDEPSASAPPEAEPDLSAPYPHRLADLEARMDRLDLGRLWVTIQEEDEVAEKTLLRHFPDADRSGGGHGLSTFLLPSYDGSLPEGSVREGAINEYCRLRYLHGARWVHVDPESIFVWYGGRELIWWPLGESLRLEVTLKEPYTLEEAKAAVVGRRTKGEKAEGKADVAESVA
jgi:hypothetical protein